MIIDCVDDAINAEKMFSDYFDTTEAEQEMQRAPPVKRVRKAKGSVTKIVPPVHAQHDSDDSEGESVTSGSFRSYFRSCLVVKNPLFF